MVLWYLSANLTPALIDCGLAKHVPADAVAHQTSTGGSFGTPGYMCSRYANGAAFDEKSEVYSFGIVMLELIVGEVQNQRRDLHAVFIEDEDEELEAAFDARAGAWPDTLKPELCANLSLVTVSRSTRTGARRRRRCRASCASSGSTVRPPPRKRSWLRHGSSWRSFGRRPTSRQRPSSSSSAPAPSASATTA